MYNYSSNLNIINLVDLLIVLFLQFTNYSKFQTNNLLTNLIEIEANLVLINVRVYLMHNIQNFLDCKLIDFILYFL
jgi:hypothetical protein